MKIAMNKFERLAPNAPYKRLFITQLNHLASLAKWLSVRL